MSASEQSPTPPPAAKVSFDRDDPVVLAFIASIGDLRKSMEGLVDENRKLFAALGQQVAPNVSGSGDTRSAADRARDLERAAAEAAWQSRTTPSPTPPPESEDQSSRPEQAQQRTAARRALSAVYRGVNKPIEWFGDTGPGVSALEEERAAETGSSTSRGGASTPSSGSGTDAAWLRMLRPRASEAITLPRYGEFTSQDVLNVMAHGIAKVAVPNADAAWGKGLGTAGGLLSTAASITPYMHVLERQTGMDLGAQDLQAESQRMGYSKQGALTIPGTGGIVIPGSQVFTKAGRETLSEDWSSFKEGLQGGISVKEAKGFNDALRAKGYTGGELEDAKKVLIDVAKNQSTAGDVGSPEVMANLYDRMMRFGSNSIDGLSTSIKGMGAIAQKSRMSLDEVYAALDQFATQQQHLGGTYTQGLQMGKDFMNVTGMTAEHLNNFQNNGVVQGMFSGMTGLLPSEMGAAPLSANMDAIYRSLDMMGGAYGKLGDRSIKDKYGTLVVSGRQQKEALLAQQFNTTPEVIHSMLANEKKFKAESSLESWATEFDKGAQHVKGNEPHQALVPGLRGIFDVTGNKIDPRYKGETAALAHEMPRLDRIMRDAGFKQSQIDKIDEAPVWKRKGMIDKLINDDKPKRNDNVVTIQLDPSLRGKFGLTTSRVKKAANSAQISMNQIGATAEPYAGVETGLPNNRTGR